MNEIYFWYQKYINNSNDDPLEDKQDNASSIAFTDYNAEGTSTLARVATSWIKTKW